MTTYKPSHIANFFLEKAERENIEISQMKLLKLVYIAYGWVIALTNQELFDEPIQAWKHGPVIPSLYNEFKHFGRRPIDTLATEFDFENGEVRTPRINGDSDDERIILSKVWDIYKDFSAWKLSSLTHQKDTPWSYTFNNLGASSDIDPELIKNHFYEKIAKYIDAGKSEHARTA